MTYAGYTGNPDEWFAEAERLRGSTELETAAVPEPESAYEGHTHEALYRMIHDDNDPGQLGDMADAWTHLANIMARFGDRLTETVNASHTAWQGDAADAARAFTAGLATWSEQTGAGAQLVAHQTLYHASAAQASRDEMPEPLPSPRVADAYQAGHTPEDQEAATTRALQQAEAAERARVRAVEVMNNYDVQIRPANRPSFPPPPSIGDRTDQDIKGLHSAAATSPSGTAVPPPTVSGSGGGPGGTTPGGAAPGGSPSGGPVTGQPPVPGVPGGPGSSGPLPGGGRVLPPVRGGTQAASAAGADTGAGGGGRGGVGAPGAGRGGPGGVAGGDRNGLLGRGGLDGAAGVRGEAGAGQAGRGGLTGVPGAAGRRQDGDEDKEHESKYLDHWDNGEVWFNDMPMTSPEVIGQRFEPKQAPKPPARRREPKL